MAGPYDAMIAKLEGALASGELTIEADGERVTYRSVEALRGAISYFEQKNAAASASSKPATTLAVFDPE